MPELTDLVSSETSVKDTGLLGRAELEELAEKIVELLLRELEIENFRTGKTFEGR